MRLSHVVSGFVLVASVAGCRDEKGQTFKERAIASALAQQGLPPEVASAAANPQALESATVAESATKITGTMHSVGGELGTFDIALNGCGSGEAAGFVGVDFYVKGSDDVRLRYVHDEGSGDVVKFGIPSKKDTLLVAERAECSVLEGAIQRSNFTTWTPKGKIRHVNGHVKFDCKHSGGKGRVTGEATFSHCH